MHNKEQSRDRRGLALSLLNSHRQLLDIAEFPGKGRGVVAATDIAAGTLIERSPVLIISDADRALADRTILFTYVFMWEHDSTEEDLYQHKGRAGIALGYASLFNHSAIPNADFVRHIDERILDVVALTDIPRGTEITIDYKMTLWFTPSAPV